jgi:hypothetical protein
MPSVATGAPATWLVTKTWGFLGDPPATEWTELLTHSLQEVR